MNRSAETPIEELDLSVRSYNCLKRHGIDTLGQLEALNEEDLYRIRNIGKRSVEEIIEKVLGRKMRPKGHILKVVLDPGAIMPTRAHENDAGMDLYSPSDAIINAGGWYAIDTGVHVAIEPGYVGKVESKSGLMAKHGLTCEGTIDSGYTGSIKAVIFNHGKTAYRVNAGDKITQLVLYPIVLPVLELVDSLSETERGTGGFGSTGR